MNLDKAAQFIAGLDALAERLERDADVEAMEAKAGELAEAGKVRRRRACRASVCAAGWSHDAGVSAAPLLMWLLKWLGVQAGLAGSEAEGGSAVKSGITTFRQRVPEGTFDAAFVAQIRQA